MKLYSHRPLRAACVETIFTKANPKSRHGKNPFTSKLEEISKVGRYKPTGVTPRVTNVKKRKGGYKAVGVESLIEGTFENVKEVLKSLGFTGFVMGAVKVSL